MPKKLRDIVEDFKGPFKHNQEGRSDSYHFSYLPGDAEGMAAVDDLRHTRESE